MKQILLSLILFLLVACTGDKPKKEVTNVGMEKLIDSVSYAVGLDVASRLKLEYKDIDYQMLNQGIEDYFAGNDLFLSDKERESVIFKYNEKIVPKYRMDLEKKNIQTGSKFLRENAKNDDVVEHRSGIQYKIIKEALGSKPKPTDLVRIHYVGKLIDGTTFDSSYSRGETAVFPVNRVVPGFSQGLQLMSPGAKYQIFIPGQLGYGSGDGPGGPMAVMIFQIELLEILSAPENIPK
ncbi:MAG: FKBP-type peptidyl-prolyl cis-trans isomerase [Candidatus Marinimicrobia bacterium]|nr:FKBP-type peptidyl-prolyl cis-trans isomerase [Candidatus Neomarinimicrobiota bacterium]